METIEYVYAVDISTSPLAPRVLENASVQAACTTRNLKTRVERHRLETPGGLTPATWDSFFRDSMRKMLCKYNPENCFMEYDLERAHEDMRTEEECCRLVVCGHAPLVMWLSLGIHMWVLRMTQVVTCHDGKLNFDVRQPPEIRPNPETFDEDAVADQSCILCPFDLADNEILSIEKVLPKCTRVPFTLKCTLTTPSATYFYQRLQNAPRSTHLVIFLPELSGEVSTAVCMLGMQIDLKKFLSVRYIDRVDGVYHMYTVVEPFTGNE